MHVKIPIHKATISSEDRPRVSAYLLIATFATGVIATSTLFGRRVSQRQITLLRRVFYRFVGRT